MPMSMSSIPFEGPENKKLPICKKCFDRPTLVMCDKCYLQVCVDCRKNHACEDKGANGQKK